ncbi:MAG: DUF5591 domain-containing protein, partial [Planctomycetota bacterium]|jgi:hypothetical protein
VLWRLLDEELVVEGHLVPEKPGPQYAWAGRTLPGPEAPKDDVPDIEGELISEFHEFVIRHYTPPEDKRLLVFFQCAVRRPFSKSPSHASMRRAVRVATGHDPARDRRECPVHVVVLASRIGAVPYELEDLYPANVRGGGVKEFSRELYARVKPVLARRIADYLVAHEDRYDRVASFTQGRYGEVVEEAAGLAGVSFPVFPDPEGPTIVRMGKSVPKSYWERYWIQLYLEITSWLGPDERADAARRLGELNVEYG